MGMYAGAPTSAVVGHVQALLQADVGQVEAADDVGADGLNLRRGANDSRAVLRPSGSRLAEWWQPVRQRWRPDWHPVAVLSRGMPAYHSKQDSACQGTVQRAADRGSCR